MNVLIAIITSSYERVQNSKVAVNSKQLARTILEIEEIYRLFSKDKVTKYYYLFFTRIRIKEEGEDEWNGLSSYIISSLRKRIDLLEERLRLNKGMIG